MARTKNTCQQCGRSFRTDRGLRVHRALAHKPEEAAPEPAWTGTPKREVDFCPCCGANIRAVRLALSMSKMKEL